MTLVFGESGNYVMRLPGTLKEFRRIDTERLLESKNRLSQEFHDDDATNVLPPLFKHT